MRKLLVLTLFLLSPMASHAESFGNAELGKAKTPSCGFCHGAIGQASNPAYPNLKGQHAQYLYQSMRDYQEGKRTTSMGQMMAAQLSRLNDQDLRDIAAFYAAQ